MQQEKIQKILANYGYGSRRYIESLIKLNKIKINDQTVGIGQRMSLITIKTVTIEKTKYSFKQNNYHIKKVILYNKPEGELCTRKDYQNRKIVFDKLPCLHNFKWINIGRLDINSCGLLLFTTDGQLAHRLMHPSFNIEKIYKVRVYGTFNYDCYQKLKHGVYLSDGYTCFNKVIFKYGTGKNKWFHVSIFEGKNRIVRRIWNKLGFKVSKLIRIGYSDVKLPNSLHPGQWMKLNDVQINELYKRVNLK